MDSYKNKNGDEILIGQDPYGTWVVSCWTTFLELHWEKKFDKEIEARVEFERWRN